MSIQELTKTSNMGQNAFHDEMDLLEEPDYQDEVMDAELEPTEEEMLDITLKGGKDIPQSEDLDMDELSNEVNEGTQDVILEDLETEESTIPGDTRIADPFDVNLPNFAEEQILPIDKEAPDLESASRKAGPGPPIKAVDTEQQPETSEKQNKQEAPNSVAAEPLNYLSETAESITKQATPGPESPNFQARTTQSYLSEGNDTATANYASADNGPTQLYGHPLFEKLDRQSEAEVVDQRDPGTETVSVKHTGKESSGGARHNLSSELDTIHPVTISFQETEMSLFPPSDLDAQGSETFLLNDRKLASESFDALFQACRSLLEDSIEDYCEFEMYFHDLQISVVETHADCVNVTLIQLIHIYLQLQHNDGNFEPPPLYVELTTKTNLRKQLQYLKDSVIQKKGLSECVSQDISDNEEIVSRLPSDPEEEPNNDIAPNLSEGQESDKNFGDDEQGNGESADKEDNSAHHRTNDIDPIDRSSAVPRLAIDKDINEVEEFLGDHNADAYIPDDLQQEIALGSTGVTTTNVVEDLGSTKHSSTEAGNLQSSEPKFDQPSQVVEDTTRAEGSSSSSTLQGDVLATEEDLLEDPEIAEGLEHVAVNDGSEEVDPQYDLEPSHEELGYDTGDKPVGYAQEGSDDGTKVQKGETLLSQELGSAQAESTDPVVLVHTAGESAEQYASYADENEADLGGRAEYTEEGQENEADQITDNYHDDPLEDKQYGTDYQGPDDDAVDHVEETSQDRTTAAMGEEADEIDLYDTATTGDPIDENVVSVDNTDNVTLQIPDAHGSHSSGLQTPKSLSRKRSLELDNDEDDLDAFEVTPKRVKPT